MLANRAEFRPREWVLAHMTDAICARTLYRTIRDAFAQVSSDPGGALVVTTEGE